MSHPYCSNERRSADERSWPSEAVTQVQNRWKSPQEARAERAVAVSRTALLRHGEMRKATEHGPLSRFNWRMSESVPVSEPRIVRVGGFIIGFRVAICRSDAAAWG